MAIALHGFEERLLTRLVQRSRYRTATAYLMARRHLLGRTGYTLLALFRAIALVGLVRVIIDALTAMIAARLHFVTTLVVFVVLTTAALDWLRDLCYAIGKAVRG